MITDQGKNPPRSGDAGARAASRAASFRARRRGNFTLTEVVMSFVLLAVALTAAAALLSFNIWAGERLERRTVAANLAKSRLERLRGLAFPDLPLLVEQDVRVNERGVPDSDGVYFRSTIVRDEYMRTRVVQTRVWSPGRSGAPPVDVSLTTILYDNSMIARRDTL